MQSWSSLGQRLVKEGIIWLFKGGLYCMSESLESALKGKSCSSLTIEWTHCSQVLVVRKSLKFSMCGSQVRMRQSVLVISFCWCLYFTVKCSCFLFMLSILVFSPCFLISCHFVTVVVHLSSRRESRFPLPSFSSSFNLSDFMYLMEWEYPACF